MYIQVNIGRNVGNTPMLDDKWNEFQGRVAFAIYNAANCWEAFSLIDNTELHTGFGAYDGVTEESCHISSYWEDGFDLDQLKTELAELKTWFGQDAIALIVGSELV